MIDPAERWAHALLALKLLAINPKLGGIALRARAGPVRDRWCASLARFPQSLRKVPLNITDDQLFGGLDVTATLTRGQQVLARGLADEAGYLMVPMAERLEPGLAARLGALIDGGRHCLIALDEGAGNEERLPDALADRLAFHIDLEGVPCAAAQSGLGTVPAPLEVASRARDIEAVAEIAEALGVVSARAPLLCLWAAQAHAALHRRRDMAHEDIEVAALLTLVPRATRVPEPENTDEAEAPPPPDHSSEPQNDAPRDGSEAELHTEILLEAIKAMLPSDILAQIAARRAGRGAKGAGAGVKRTGNRKGRPLPSRPGRLDGRARLDLVATLRAAAPLQTLRRSAQKRDRLIEIRASDIRVKRYEERSDRLLVFAVDASGSAAFARLAEAKGAIELLLVDAYAARDHVALVGFRGVSAEVLLPPTRSLVQTKKRLAALPGGGGTPLAAGIKAATELALLGQSRGMSATLILLTDGRANVALDGEADRQRAGADATRMARAALVQGLDALVIDVGKRPERSLRTLAETMDAIYLPLPRADAKRLSNAVSGALR
ncbi:MAG: magnesium chelatase subunit D [Pseudomonadota bacterium]